MLPSEDPLLTASAIQSPRLTTPLSIWRRVWRKSLIIPAEHGAWSWLAVPFLVGLALGRPWHIAQLLALILALAVFLLRQPLTVFIRVQRGRARRDDKAPALLWLCGLLTLTALCLAGLILLQRTALAGLWPVVVSMGLLYLGAIVRSASSVRTAWLQIVGAAGLAVTAPLAVTAASGQLTPWEWGLWGVMAGLNVLGALYIRQRVAAAHDRPASRLPMLLGHVAGCILIVGAAWAGQVPWLVTLAFGGLTLRAVWLTRRPPLPSPAGQMRADIRRIGMVETGVELLCGLWVVLSYWSF